MNREAIERLISLDLDGELDASQRQQLEAIMAEQPQWAALRQELADQKALCQTPAPEPPAHLYPNLQRQVTQKYAAPAPVYRISFATKLAVAAAVVLAFLAGYLLPRQLAAPEAVASLPMSQELDSHLLRAKAEYLAAIHRLEDLAEAHIQQMPPEVAVQVANNLEVVDQAIAACEDFAIAYPNHYLAHASLAKAYQAKVDLLQTLVEGSFSRS